NITNFMENRGKMKVNSKILGLFAAGVAGGVIVLAGFYIIGDSPGETKVVKRIVEVESGTPASTVSLLDDSPELTKDFTHASEETVHAVVHITTTYDRSYSRDPFYEYFYGPGYGQAKATGSGVILTDDGYIVTNNHVIDAADKI